MPWWVRAWSQPPLRALGRFEEWLWEHGGYDVEGPDVTVERERLTARYEIQDAVIEAALDGPGPWPVSSTVRTQDVEVVDVDRYERRAVVIAAIAEDSHGDGATLNAAVFRREEGTWRWLGGGGIGWARDPLLVRQEWGDNDHHLKVPSKGWHAPLGKRGSKPACDATLLCSPAVSSLTVNRPGGRRIVDVSTGPGWIGIVWPEASEPSVTAFDAGGNQVAVLEPEDLRYSTRSRSWRFQALRRPWFAWTLNRRGRGWLNYQPRMWEDPTCR
jgi:hypothetical protein